MKMEYVTFPMYMPSYVEEVRATSSLVSSHCDNTLRYTAHNTQSVHGRLTYLLNY